MFIVQIKRRKKIFVYEKFSVNLRAITKETRLPTWIIYWK